jgi:hypothetical protein
MNRVTLSGIAANFGEKIRFNSETYKMSWLIFAEESPLGHAKGLPQIIV